jgi:hypothetical protein
MREEGVVIWLLVILESKPPNLAESLNVGEKEHKERIRLTSPRLFPGIPSRMPIYDRVQFPFFSLSLTDVCFFFTPSTLKNSYTTYRLAFTASQTSSNAITHPSIWLL